MFGYKVILGRNHKDPDFNHPSMVSLSFTCTQTLSHSLSKNTVDAQIFVGTIFRGLNFHGDKFSWVVVAHKNLTPTKNYLLVVHKTGMAQREEDVE